MKFDKNLAVIHGYLCSDGSVVRNQPSQKHKYYRIQLRNTDKTLLEDFRDKFQKKFNLKPSIYKNQRTLIHSKELYFELYLSTKILYDNNLKSLPWLEYVSEVNGEALICFDVICSANVTFDFTITAGLSASAYSNNLYTAASTL